jgi:hypothetical protein
MIQRSPTGGRLRGKADIGDFAWSSEKGAMSLHGMPTGDIGRAATRADMPEGPKDQNG